MVGGTGVEPCRASERAHVSLLRDFPPTTRKKATLIAAKAGLVSLISYLKGSGGGPGEIYRVGQLEVADRLCCFLASRGMKTA